MIQTYTNYEKYEEVKNTLMVAQQAEMDDIMSSIKASVAEESAKVGSGSADLIDAAAVDEDILELTDAEMVVPEKTDDAANVDELIDLQAFAQTGEVKAAEETPQNSSHPLGEDILTNVEAIIPNDGISVLPETAPAVPEPVATPAGDSADEFDRLLAEISHEQKQLVVAAEEQKQALMEEEVPLGAEPLPVEQPANEVSSSVDVPAMPATDLLEGVSGLQISLPAEVLALALRPMVQEWLKANLADIVERLVKEEISKLT